MKQRIVITLDEYLKNDNIKQKDFAEKTGLRTATVSQLVNNKYDRIQLDHLLKVMQTLGITDFNKILKIVDVDEQG